jgi:hypothetical protein
MAWSCKAAARHFPHADNIAIGFVPSKQKGESCLQLYIFLEQPGCQLLSNKRIIECPEIHAFYQIKLKPYQRRSKEMANHGRNGRNGNVVSAKK